MAPVRYAREPEIGETGEFLTTHVDSSLDKERFQNLFCCPLRIHEPGLGVVLEAGGRAERFRNLSGWYVRPKQSDCSLSLLSAAHRQGESVFTGLTSRRAVRRIGLALYDPPPERLLCLL